jgi:hypothetical protein
MKTAIGSLTLALTLIVTPAAAQSTSAAAEGPRIVPPPEFDHPFPDSKLTIVTARDQKHVRELCPTAKFVAGFPVLACSYPMGHSLWPLTMSSEKLDIRLSWSGVTRLRTATAGHSTIPVRYLMRSGR